MNAAAPLDECVITLGDAPVADAFGLSMTYDGDEVMATVVTVGPGLFRTRRGRGGAEIAAVGQFFASGAIVGVLQRGVLALPVQMPEDGWLAASAPDGTRVEYGTPVIRYIRATEAITP